jgi:hypothetical protein
MKRNLKRLTLNRETVRHLNEGEMAAAQGGVSERQLCMQLTEHTCPSHCGQWYCQGV